MTSPDVTATTEDWQARADEAARSVTRMFGQRLFFLPGTHIGAIVRPSSRLKNLVRPWHYWWQAHYVDCLVDAGRRELARAADADRAADPESAAAPESAAPGNPAASRARSRALNRGVRFDGGNRPGAGQLATRLVTGIRLRNFLTFVNNFYDDMAWLALATLRLEKLAEESREPARRRNARIRKSLTLQFDSASTDDLGGGTFWSKERDFKNTPATAPVALYYARTGNSAKAQALLDWLHNRLFDPALGMYQDGLRIGSSGEVVLEAAIYTYNQGPALGALLELGGQANLDRAAGLVDAVARNLAIPATPASGRAAATPESATPASGRAAAVLRCDGTGDGGLFTGILARYLALAATDGRLPERTRAAAGTLVTDTARAFWDSRREVAPDEPLARNGAGLVFSALPEEPASRTYPAGAAVELSTQLQAWMILEAAASVSAAVRQRPGN
jgi:predicted alpha-1,6-mannanase (GH76 family)